MGTQPSRTGVTYLNEDSNGIYKRYIHFDVQWIGDGAIAVASAIDAIEHTGMTVQRNDPGTWWVDGGGTNVP